jgi:spore germination cell wall hydrolase CwlJ-like protein
MYLTNLVKYFGVSKLISVNTESRKFTIRRIAAAALAAAALIAVSAPAQAKTDPGVERDIECLALTIYHEARGEPGAGQVAVGHVVMNRVYDHRFPKSVCDVVQQGGYKVRNRCHFSWYCDDLSDTPRNGAAWDNAKTLARRIYWGFSEDPTDGALWYHADYVKPSWSKSFNRGPMLGRHIFYLAFNDRTY